MHLAGSGRTSIPADPAIDPALYRTAGYRLCGARAVRVDILERLADLIRPALAWRDGAAGSRPAGAVSGGGFTVVNTMTSLIGASGEDFASILRALGYRMERRPKPPEQAPASAKPPSPETSAPASADAPLVEDPASAPQAVPAEAGIAASSALAPADPVEGSEVLGAAHATASVGAPDVPPASEPEVIEVWRPSRTGDRRRVHARGRRPKPGEAAEWAHKGPEMATLEPATLAAVASKKVEAPAEVAEADVHGTARRHGRPRRPQQRLERQERRREREPGKRFEPRDKRPEKRPDPNSPFAKLAALKAQLEADAKERR
jgi:ATP-dependent RNA helicase SUPV3L1/SUV3